MAQPNMAEGLSNWEGAGRFILVTKSVSDYEVSEKESPDIAFYGVFYPSQPMQVILKPEGQRTWRWWTLITSKDMKLDDKIRDMKKVEYRIMQKKDWSQGGFFEYELVEAFHA